ncbi:uncharacterized protein LOC121726344 [Aricia agestis]|uniref:uncharacterized protein LOC121726344 n=1 Tax=Aricia agestis TaxID=91739 RepID=UPI001C203524|nr:uncharacterized protein LOC121726344 [Aricia agestis]
MHFLVSFILACVILANSAEMSRKEARFITFDTDNNDIQVGLDFSIPFIKIPLKKFDAFTQFDLEGLSFPKINVNPSGLAISGFLLIVTSLLAPIFNNAFLGWLPDRRSRDAGLDTQFPMEVTEKILKNSRGCPQRFACWLSQKSNRSESLDTWNGLLRNELLSQIFNTTRLVRATARGLKGLNCEAYSPCPINNEALPQLISSFNILKNS